MCGICGTLNFDPSEPANSRLVRDMTASLAHRGPDDEGFHAEGPVALGHRRLSIIDLGGGRQPIYNEDRSIVIVFNGEIYNYAGLTLELMARGHTFRTQSDTEAIVHAYEEFGDECVERLRGMFAFALWDRRRNRLLLVRDRLGIKPLYYCQVPGLFAFASEIKALLHVPGLRREVDPTALDFYLSLRYVPGPRTMFRGIQKLQPGHLLVADANGVRISRYWDIEYGEPESRSVDPLESFEQLLHESVELRLIAEVPLGVFLSGGVDSSAILAVMSRIRHGEKIKTFSVGYEAGGAGAGRNGSGPGEEEESNEFAYARLAARAFNAEHHEFHLNAGDFRDFIPQLVWDLDEPLADPSCIPLYFIARLARQHITVVLSGEGADEILAGYSIYQKMLALENIRRHTPFASKVAAALALLARGGKTNHYLRLAQLPLERRYRGVSRALLPDWKERLLRPARGAETLDDLYEAHYQRAAYTNTLNRMLYVDAKVWLPDDLLLKADKMTMANALELRVPFLDHKLVEFAARLPMAAKINNGSGKALLREAMSGVLPDAILNRPKKGFPVPTRTWLGGQLRQFTRDALLSRDSACREHFDARVIEQLVGEQERGTADRNQELWSLLIFEYWHRVYVSQRLQPAARQTAERKVA